MKNKMIHTYTHLNEPECDLNIWQCNDCGAYADTKENIKHHASCKPGEAIRWEKYYSKNQEAK